MEKAARQSAAIPGFLPPATHGVLKSLLETPQRLPPQHHGEPGRKCPLSVTAGCLCDAVEAKLQRVVVFRAAAPLEQKPAHRDKLCLTVGWSNR